MDLTLQSGREIKMFKTKLNYLPKDFQYPKEFIKIIELGLININPWQILDKNELIKIRYDGMKKRYPNRALIPFAQRLDNDDVACFEIGSGNTVQIIHDFSSPGYEQREIYNDFWEWFNSAINEMINFD